jgi:hypothetical protein
VTQLVDDRLLGDVLRGDAPPVPGEPVFTTGYWYVRLCQAVSGGTAVSGALSRPFATLPPDARARAIRAALQLPESIGLVSLRELAPRIGQLRRTHQLNILGMEVLAAAQHVDAAVFLSAASPRLEAALRQEGCKVSVTR